MFLYLYFLGGINYLLAIEGERRCPWLSGGEESADKTYNLIRTKPETYKLIVNVSLFAEVWDLTGRVYWFARRQFTAA